MLRINHPVKHLVTKLFPQRTNDHIEGAALVVALQVFDVLKEKGGRTIGFDNAGNIEKQSALRITRKTMKSAQRVFLENARDRERLARKPRHQDIVVRNVVSQYLRD